MKNLLTVLGFATVAAFAPTAASAQAFNSGLPAGSTCLGSCGTLGANGVVSLSGLSGSTAYGWVSTNNGVAATANGIGFNIGSETDGSLWTYNFSTVNPNTLLSFRFNYITSDGTSGFVEYAYASLLGGSTPVTLFNARTTPSGNTVPGFGLPPIDATIVPASTPIISVTPLWAPLGGSSGACFGGLSAGCGHTGWISMFYTIETAGDYSLAIGVINWGDTAFESGMAFDFALDGGVPVIPDTTVPEPATLALLATGLTGLGAARRRRRNS